MDFERENKLPEGVGKRIIEVLKTNVGNSLDDTFDYAEPIVQPDISAFHNPEEPEYRDYTYSYDAKNEIYPESSRNYIENEPVQTTSANSSHIETLVGLVTKLPSGVTKQTGAQIIRHTMEAMGIPMNQVLTKAQQVQEELEQNVRGHINAIEEHRAKIKTLDAEIQQFRKKARDLEDIINLFILSDKK